MWCEMSIEELRANIETKTNPLYFQQCQVDAFKSDFASDIRSLLLHRSSLREIHKQSYSSQKNKEFIVHCYKNILL